MQNMGLIAARGCQRELQGIDDILSPHGRAQLPRDDVAGEIVEDGGEIIPAPADDLQVRKISLP